MKKQMIFTLALTLAQLATAVWSMSITTLDSVAASTMLRDAARASAAPLAAGNVIPAASCSQQDVQAAINAAHDGDFVLVPPGSCTWTTLTANQSAVVVLNKSITLRGAGIDKTFIKDDTSGAWGEWGFHITEAAGNFFRITGFTFTGKAYSSNAEDYFIVIDGSSRTWRLDHCKFTAWTAGAPFYIRRSMTYGVLDHNIFDYDFPDQPIQIGNLNTASWEQRLSLGTADAVYIEDNLFNNTGDPEPFIDSEDGARVVVRYNILHNSAYHNHGRDSGAVNFTRSTLSYEIYNNTFTNTGPVRWCAMSTRGGTGVVFNNTITGNYDTFMLLYNYCSCWGYSGSCQCWPRCTRYPCTDQVGRAPDDNSDGVQDLEPLYEWGNTISISGSAEPHLQAPTTLCPEMNQHIQPGRDYYNNTQRPGYQPYTYPHPLTKELWLNGVAANQAIHLNWSTTAWTYLPPTATWTISYSGGPGSPPLPISGLPSATRAYTLTGLTNYALYDVTLNAMLNGSPILTDTVRVMPSDRLLYLPVVSK